MNGPKSDSKNSVSLNGMLRARAPSLHCTVDGLPFHVSFFSKMLLLVLAVMTAVRGASMPMVWGEAPDPPIWQCFGRLKEARGTPQAPSLLHGNTVQPYRRNPKLWVRWMLDSACDVVVVTLSSPLETGPAANVQHQFGRRFTGYVENTVKGRAAAGDRVILHLMSPQDIGVWRAADCPAWRADDEAMAPTEAAPVRVAVSGDIAHSPAGDLLLYVDPCGLMHVTSTDIVAPKSAPVRLGQFLQNRVGQYPIAFVHPPPSLGAPPSQGISFPYNPFFYLLDLSVLTYNLYAQSTVFNYDPFYEQQTEKMRGGGISERRVSYITKLQTYLESQAESLVPKLNSLCLGQDGQVDQARAASCVRGPDVVSFMTRKSSGKLVFGPSRAEPAGGLIDPILTRYSNMDPSRRAHVSHEGDDGVGRSNTEWRYFVPPRELTEWRGAYIVFRDLSSSGIRMQRLRMQYQSSTSANDIYVFEGVAGATSSVGSVAMFGLVVTRPLGTSGDYVVDIAWRGSRSGKASDAFLNGLAGRGNPDWISDLDMKFRSHATMGAGKTHAGYTRCIRETMPILLPLLRFIHNQFNRPPLLVFVTGHSMGGGLATLFVKAMTSKTANSFGDPAVLGAKLASWPWAKIKLVAYSAPIIMDSEAARTMNTKRERENKFAADPQSPQEVFDDRPGLLGVTRDTADFGDASLQTRALSDLTIASMYRVIHPHDPIGWHLPLTSGALECALRRQLGPGLVNTCTVGRDLFTDRSDKSRIPNPVRYHEPFWLAKGTFFCSGLSFRLFLTLSLAVRFFLSIFSIFTIPYFPFRSEHALSRQRRSDGAARQPESHLRHRGRCGRRSCAVFDAIFQHARRPLFRLRQLHGGQGSLRRDFRRS